MTDKDIIKALELLLDRIRAYECNNVSIDKDLITSIVDLINRLKVRIKRYQLKNTNQKNELARLNEKNAEQKAEIERLQDNNQKLYDEMAERQKEEVAIVKRMGKTEAIKEFAERLHKEAVAYGGGEIVFDFVIDNLVKEMTEGKE